jgi:hypothetical protein
MTVDMLDAVWNAAKAGDHVDETKRMKKAKHQRGLKRKKQKL